MPAFIFAIFVSAFLLFQIQPIIARYILPWYGGSPGVWTTCMLFFQVGLLGGYAYAHLLVSRFREKPHWQIGIHLALLIASFFWLPITPDEDFKPTGAEASPVAGIILLLLSSVGLPYILISASGPLLQHWFGAVAAGRSPYRLYAVSNLGSLLGLLTYPVLFEPHLRLGQQTGLWSGGYVFYGILALVCGWLFLRATSSSSAGAPITSGEAASEGEEVKAAPGKEAPPPAPAFSSRIFWVAFAACGSILLLAITNKMCQDVAVVPFLWVLPLSLYLITFIISFDQARWYWRPVWIPLAIASIAALIYLLDQDFGGEEMHLYWQIAIYCSALFTCCMICHGEMVRLKPHPRYLTSFYLAVSLGGALGGAFVSLAAPRLFSGYWELHFGLLVFAGLATYIVLRGYRRVLPLPAAAVLTASVVVVLGAFLKRHIDEAREYAIESTRGFYGVLRAYEGENWLGDSWKALYHGRISHGRQVFSEDLQREPITYYSAGSGPGALFFNYPARIEDNPEPIHFGVVGLGIGTLSAYAEPGDRVRFYEINSQVEDLARQHFTYLEDCEGGETVVLGDARITLEQELAAGDIQDFDMLFVDAFSGDSIPIHLLTREAFELYFKHLKPDGVLAVHITNLHLDLSDPVRVLAREFGKEAIQIEFDSDEWEHNYSRWILVSANNDLNRSLEDSGMTTLWEAEDPREIHWTDDYSNLFQVIEWEEDEQVDETEPE